MLRQAVSPEHDSALTNSQGAVKVHATFIGANGSADIRLVSRQSGLATSPDPVRPQRCRC